VGTKLKIKFAIFGTAVLLMGSMGISGGLAVIAEAFGEESQTAIQMMVSLPCLLMIPCSLIMGKLQTLVAKKILAVIGISLYLAGGLVPVFLHSIGGILILRSVYGIGVGILAPLLTVLVTEYFEEPERSKVMGQQVSVQMIGCAVMVLVGGYLADAGWNKTYLIYIVAVASLIIVLVFLPFDRPEKDVVKKNKVKLNRAVWGWTAAVFSFFIAGQIFATFTSFLIDTQGFGAGAEAGQSAMLFTVGGFIMGLFYGKLNETLKAFTLPAALLLIFVSFLMIALAPNILLVFLGSLLSGFTFAIVTSSFLIHASSAVDAWSVPMAISVMICSQSAAQFISPAIISPLANTMNGDPNHNAFLLGAVIYAVMTGVFLVKAMKNNKPQKNEIRQG
jgi:MFS family permease